MWKIEPIYKCYQNLFIGALLIERNMKKLIFILLLTILVIGCAKKAEVEKAATLPIEEIPKAPVEQPSPPPLPSA